MGLDGFIEAHLNTIMLVLAGLGLFSIVFMVGLLFPPLQTIATGIKFVRPPT